MIAAVSSVYVMFKAVYGMLVLADFLNYTFFPRVSELVAQHEAQRQEDMLALQEKEKR